MSTSAWSVVGSAVRGGGVRIGLAVGSGDGEMATALKGWPTAVGAIMVADRSRALVTSATNRRLGRRMRAKKVALHVDSSAVACGWVNDCDGGDVQVVAPV